MRFNQLSKCFGMALLNVLACGSIAYASDEVVLDVRTLDEYSQGHVQGAQQIDFNSADFKEKLSKLDKSKSYRVYCRSGGRAGKAVKMMKDMNFKSAESLGGVKDALKTLNKKCEGNCE